MAAMYYMSKIAVVATLLASTSVAIAGAQLSGEAYVPLETPLGSFTPSSNVADEVGVSVTVKDIKSHITSEKFDEAKSSYSGNAYLSGLGKGSGLSGPDFTAFVSYFGSAAANDDYLADAFNAAPTTPAAAAEMVEKTVMDGIPVLATLSYANEATAADWDKACALFIGDGSNSPYGRANKRAANYGTFASGTEEALANQNILNACNDGPSSAGYETIKKNLQIIYTQAAIRYAFLLDIDLTSNPPLSTEDHRSEGQAFYRIIAPYVKPGNSSCDAAVSAIYDVNSGFPEGAGGYYCTAIQCIPPTMGISATELGTLESTENACTGRASSGAPATSGAPGAGSDDDGSGSDDESSATGFKFVLEMTFAVVALCVALL